MSFMTTACFLECRNNVKKKRPETLPTPLIFKDGDKIFDLPVTGRPFATIMPVWGPPGILAGAQPRGGFPVYQFVAQGFMPKGLRSKLRLDPNGEKFKINLRGTLKFHNLRTRHHKNCLRPSSCTVWPTGFRRLVLPDIILGRYRYISYFVGADIEILRRHIQTIYIRSHFIFSQLAN